MTTDRPNANSAASLAPAAAAREEAKSADRLRWLEGKSAVRLQWLKEGVTALLGVGIVGYTLYMTYRAFGMAGDPTRMGDAKDLLAYLSSFAGLVVGYYFGRVPADARTVQAQQQIGQAVSEMEQTKGTMGDMKEKLAGLEDKMESGEQLRAADIRQVREMA
jgi:hypothetical protein